MVLKSLRESDEMRRLFMRKALEVAPDLAAGKDPDQAVSDFEAQRKQPRGVAETSAGRTPAAVSASQADKIGHDAISFFAIGVATRLQGELDAIGEERRALDVRQAEARSQCISGLMTLLDTVRASHPDVTRATIMQACEPVIQAAGLKPDEFEQLLQTTT